VTDRAFNIVATGFVSIEAPRLDRDGSLYFSDMRAGGVHRLLGDGRIEVVVPERTLVGGICLHAHGGLVVSGAELSHVRDGESRVLLGLPEDAGAGAEAVAFNDIEADRDGRLFAGVVRQDSAGAYVPGELIRLTGAGRHEVIHDDIQANGMGLSPDGSRLYAADTFHRRILVFELRGAALPTLAGEISTQMLPGAPDGLAVDEHGCLWVAFYRGGCVGRFTPDGRLAERLDVPAVKPLSVCIGPDGGGQLYVVTGRSDPGAPDAGTIYRTSIGVGPAPVDAACV
jgi:sugar lactone lactonase YvrE